MRVAVSKGLALGLAVAVFCTARTSMAQDVSDQRPVTSRLVQVSHAIDADSSMNTSTLPPIGTDARPWQSGCADGPAGNCAKGNSSCPWAQDCGFYGGADFLLLHTRFSQAYAFAQVFQTQAPPIVRDVQAVVLPFDYDASFRVFVGYQLGDNAGDFRFTYWHLRTDARTGEKVSSGEFIVDPLGFMAQPGDLITAHASVENNVYDLDFNMPILAGTSHWAITGSIGVRIAEIDQSYDDPILTPAGAVMSNGFFTAHFIGAGPRLGLEARRYFGEAGRLSLFAKGNGSLLVGDYDFKAGAALPVFAASQSTHLTRTIPVAEMELGVSWRPAQFLTLSAGWLFQAWFDLGASGGQFGGIYVPVDTANIMSFDGLVLRAELSF